MSYYILPKINSMMNINPIDSNNTTLKTYISHSLYNYYHEINKQIQKYLDSYGPGCIIFNHGFNSKISFHNVLLLDYDCLL